MKHRFEITRSIFSPTVGLHDTGNQGFYLGGLVVNGRFTFSEDENNEFCIQGAMKIPVYRVVP